jgi:hypothetical protein
MQLPLMEVGKAMRRKVHRAAYPQTAHSSILGNHYGNHGKRIYRRRYRCGDHVVL